MNLMAKTNFESMSPLILGHFLSFVALESMACIGHFILLVVQESHNSPTHNNSTCTDEPLCLVFSQWLNMLRKVKNVSKCNTVFYTFTLVVFVSYSPEAQKSFFCHRVSRHPQVTASAIRYHCRASFSEIWHLTKSWTRTHQLRPSATRRRLPRNPTLALPRRTKVSAASLRVVMFHEASAFLNVCVGVCLCLWNRPTQLAGILPVQSATEAACRLWAVCVTAPSATLRR